MKLELEVLASSSIKRKKPWPLLAWLGQAQESVFLLDSHRASILYIPSGKTKRRLAKLQPLLDGVSSYNHSNNGQFVVGLQQSGDVFLWHKDTDMVKYIKGMPNFAQKPSEVTSQMSEQAKDEVGRRVFVADDGSKVLVVYACEVYVWELDRDQAVFATRPPQLYGSWSLVSPLPDTPLPTTLCSETDMDTTFYIDDALGLCCNCTIVFNAGQDVCITTLWLRWMEAQHIYTYSRSLYTADWTTIRKPLSELCHNGQPIRKKGAYLISQSHGSQMVAIAVNQESSHENKVLFVSPLTSTVIVTDLLGCGAKNPVTEKASRGYWIADIKWTYDDLFVVAMTEQGSICVLTRMGEPLLIRTCGHSMDMGPRFYLPIHPLIIIQGSSQNYNRKLRRSGDEVDPMRQRFSVAPHPRLPLLLCSDGYMVTALQFPGEISCLGLMKGLVTESSQTLRLIRDQQKMQITLFDTLRRSGKAVRKGKSGPQRLRLRIQDDIAERSGMNDTPPGLVYHFEEPGEDALEGTLDTDVTDWVSPLAGGGMEDAGKIVFGDMDNMNTSMDFEAAHHEEGMSVTELIGQSYRRLMAAWGLATTHTGLWTQVHEDVATNLIHNFTKIFSVILQASPEHVKKLAPGREVVRKKATKNLKICKVLSMLKKVFYLLELDVSRQHLAVCIIRLAEQTVSLILRSKDLQQQEPRIDTLHGCFVLLRFVQSVLAQVYTSVPHTVRSNGLPVTLQAVPHTVRSNGLPVTLQAVPHTVRSNGLPVTLQAVFGDVYQPAVLAQISLIQQDTSHNVSDQSAIQSVTNPNIMQTNESQAPMPSSERFEITRRLGPVWKLLFKHTVQQYRLLCAQAKLKKKDRFQAVVRLMCTLQLKLQSLSINVGPAKKHALQPGDRLAIEGCPIPAVQAWVQKLSKSEEVVVGRESTVRLLHAVLYSLLLQNELRSAIEFTELLLRQQDVRTAASLYRQDQETKLSVLALLQQIECTEMIAPPCYINCHSVLRLVQSVARVMAAYFTNSTIFVYPPHTPRCIPPLHKCYYIGDRVLPLYQDKLNTEIRQSDLSEVWTPERTLEYLMITGLLPEAAWYAHSLGDWKTAFVISATLEDHRKRMSHKGLSLDPGLRLPLRLQPRSILQGKLQSAFRPGKQGSKPEGVIMIDEETDTSQLSRSLSDVLLAATVSDVDLSPWLLEGLIGQMKDLARQASPLVPDGVYLPAPPVYCPQPALPHQSESDVDEEMQLRRDVSSVIQLFLLILSSCRSTLPAARWYAKKILNAFFIADKFRTEACEEPDIPILQDAYLSPESLFSGREMSPSIHTVLACFRDFCSIIWMFYVRDKLSLSLRKKLQLAERQMCEGDVSETEWQSQCEDVLEWATHMLVFSRYLNADNQLFGITLSLIIELPQTLKTASILATYFHDTENMDPEIQEKLEGILKNWRGVFVAGEVTPRGHIKVQGVLGKSPRQGKSLSLIYHKQARKMTKIYQKKAKAFGKFEVFLFDSDSHHGEESGMVQNGIVHIGSRPFESDASYLHFLDMFYAVCLHRDVDNEAQTGHLRPLLQEYSREVREQELHSLAHKAVSSLHKRQSFGLSPSSPIKTNYHFKFTEPAKTKLSPRSQPPKSPRSGKVGLFRSRSFSDLHSDSGRRSRMPQTSSSIARRASSHENLNTSGLEESPRRSKVRGVGASKPPSASPRNSTMVRSTSIESRFSNDGEDKAVDPLTSPVMPSKLLEHMDFGPGYDSTEQLLTWLLKWAGHNHVLSTTPDYQGAMRLHMHPRLMVYALWQVDYNQGDSPPSDREENNQNEDSFKLEEETITKANKKAKHAKKSSENIVAEAEVYETNIEVGPTDETVNGYRPPKLDLSLLEADRRKAKKAKKAKKEKKRKKKTPEVATIVEDDESYHHQDQFQHEVMGQEEVTDMYLPPPIPHLPPRRELLAPTVPDTDNDHRRSISQASESTLTLSSLREEEVHATLVDEQFMRSGGSDVVGESTMAGSRGFGRSGGSEFVGESTMAGSRGLSHMATNTTMPFPEDTPRSQTSEHEVLASELRSIVRKEMRKIVEAQHRGILAMLGAMNESSEDDPTIPQSRKKSGKKARRKQDQTPRHNKDTEYVVNYAQSDIDVSSLSTDIEVTPLPSEEISYNKFDKPLSLSDLAKVSPLKGAKGGNPGAVRGALHELKLLENQAIPSWQGRVPQDKLDKEAGKENLPVRDPGLQSAPPAGTGPSPGDQPFSRVMGMLKRMNQNILGASNFDAGNPPRLLSFEATPSRSDPVRLPHVQQTEMAPQVTVSASVVTGLPPMPLLRLGTRHTPAPSHPNLDEIPVRDMPSHQPPSVHTFSNHAAAPPGYRFPLLHLPNRPRLFTHIEDQNGIPRLVPPDELMAHYHRKQHEEMLREKEQRDMRQRVVAEEPQQPIGSHLLKVNLKSFQIGDDRESAKRKARRKKKAAEEAENKKIQMEKDVELQEPVSSPLETMTSEFGIQVEPPVTNVVTEGVQTSARSSPRKQPSPEKEDEKQEEPVKLHSGYAITPGMFDDYLEKQDELGSVADTNAKLQFKAAMGTKPPKVGEKKESGMQTDSGWLAVTAAMDKPPGTDPVQDAIDTYTRARRSLGAGGLLPPDIYLGLRFADNQQSADEEYAQADGSSGRAFLNVVDIDSRTLDDLVSSVPEKEDRGIVHAADMKGSPTRQAFRDISTLDRQEVIEEEERPPGPDSVTARLLLGPGQAQRGDIPADEIARSSHGHNKEAIRRRLEDMNAQITAMDAMANNMEADFKNTKLLMHTIEQMGEAIHPEESLYPPARVLQPRDQREHLQGEPLRPSHIKQFRQQDKQQQLTNERDIDDGQTPAERVQDIKARLGQTDDMEATLTENHLELTGLSGVSDIVGEVIAKGGVDAEEAGLSQRDMMKLSHRARKVLEKSDADLSREKLEEVFQSPRQRHKPRQQERTEEEKRQLQEWMEEKRQERMRQFRLKQSELREIERQPFKQQNLGTSTVKDLQEARDERVSQKKAREQEFAERRKMLASELMGDILSDHPALPSEPQTSTARSSRGVKQRRGSPVRKVAGRERRDKVVSAWGTDRPVRMEMDTDRTNVHIDDYADVHDSYDYDVATRHRAPPRESWDSHGSSMPRTQTVTSGALGAYTRQLEDMQESWESLPVPESARPGGQDKPSPIPEESEPAGTPPVPPSPKQKSFKDMVKLQRPELTRKDKGFKPQPQTYQERLSSMRESGETPRSSSTARREQERLFGTKRLPGSYKATERTAPRVLKTYQERLHEMKESRPFTSTLTPRRRTAPPGGRATLTRERDNPLRRSQPMTRKVKPRKTLTYAEQLKQLQPPKDMYRTGTSQWGTATGGSLYSSQRSTLRKKKGPPHKPKTYGEQLRELQQPATTRPARQQQPGPRMEHAIYRTLPAHQRTRPYADPYAELEEENASRASVVSPWAVDPDIHNMLYDGQSTYLGGTSAGATSMDLSQLTELQDMGYLAADDYITSVSVEDLQDAVSVVSSGSIMSYIDWDQVDKLIADVK